MKCDVSLWGTRTLRLLSDAVKRRFPTNSISYLFLKNSEGLGRFGALPKEPISQVLSGSNPELGKLANKPVNKFDLLGRLISVVQCILL